MTKKKFSMRHIALAVLLLILAAGLGVLAVWLIRLMTDPQIQTMLEQWVSSLGVWGVLGMFAIQILQIVLAFLPGEPVELVAGTLYGAFGGLLICMVGIWAGSFCIFTIVRRLGRKKLEEGGKLKSHMAKYQFLQNEKKLDTIIFILYLIPGTPKDILVYVCALTNISRSRFLLLSTIARIPSVITSTWAGSAFADGNWGLMLVIFAVTAVMGLLGVYSHNRLIARKNRDKPVD